MSFLNHFSLRVKSVTLLVLDIKCVDLTKECRVTPFEVYQVLITCGFAAIVTHLQGML